MAALKKSRAKVSRITKPKTDLAVSKRFNLGQYPGFLNGLHNDFYSYVGYQGNLYSLGAPGQHER